MQFSIIVSCWVVCPCYIVVPNVVSVITIYTLSWLSHYKLTKCFSFNISAFFYDFLSELMMHVVKVHPETEVAISHLLRRLLHLALNH